MRLKKGVLMVGLHPIMRPVKREAEKIWREVGRAEGVTITSGLDGVHSANSWHHHGLALDFRTNYANHNDGENLPIPIIANMLREVLPGYDVVEHKTHIHVEIGNILANQIGVLY